MPACCSALASSPLATGSLSINTPSQSKIRRSAGTTRFPNGLAHALGYKYFTYVTFVTTDEVYGEFCMHQQQLMIRAAWLYHVEGLTQAEIGERMNLTRRRVNELL